jgi:ribosomal protein S4
LSAEQEIRQNRRHEWNEGRQENKEGEQEKGEDGFKTKQNREEKERVHKNKLSLEDE